MEDDPLQDPHNDGDGDINQTSQQSIPMIMIIFGAGILLLILLLYFAY